jgi:hypothetical protein
MRTRAVLAALAVLALLACGDGPLDVGAFSVEGSWTGNARFAVGAGPTADTARYDFVLDLEQTEADISGSGQVVTDAETLEVEVDGVWEYPSVSLVLSAPEFIGVDFDATFATPDSLKGTLSGSGFNSVALTLIRQP